MAWRSNFVDVSSCMLFETVGDSEATDSNNVNHHNYDDEIIIDGSKTHHEYMGLADEDDACSCSCETEYDNPKWEYYVYDDDDEEQKDETSVGLVVDEDVVEDEDEDEEDEDAVDQVQSCYYVKGHNLKRNISEWSPEGEGEVMDQKDQQRMKKLKVCGADFLNEREKDRHFWETCLAS